MRVAAVLFASLLISTPSLNAQADPAPVRVSGGVMAGQLLTHPEPVYPPESKASGVQGAVVLHAVISKDGTVGQLTPVSGNEQLRKAATDAVAQWTYRPYLLNGNPVVVDTTVTVNFASLRRSRHGRGQTLETSRRTALLYRIHPLLVVRVHRRLILGQVPMRVIQMA